MCFLRGAGAVGGSLLPRWPFLCGSLHGCVLPVHRSRLAEPLCATLVLSPSTAFGAADCAPAALLRRLRAPLAATHASATCHAWRCVSSTGPLRARRERRVSTKSDVADMLGTLGDSPTYSGSTPLELSLFEDPTAGLACGPAEELTPAELDTKVRALVASYTPSMYRLLYTPFVDVVGTLVREGLLPVDEAGGSGAGASSCAASGTGQPLKVEEVMARWFSDGPATLKAPHMTAALMGKRRWAALCVSLEAHWAPLEEVMPLTRVVRQHGLREDLYVPLFRELAMELVDPTKRPSTVVTLPGIILSLANGRAPRSLGLPVDDTARVRLVSSLFLGVGQETGNTDVAYLGIQLLRANRIETPFSAQKQLTAVFAAQSRIQTDWQTRSASLLTAVFPKWVDYLKRVQADNRESLAALERGGVAVTAARGTGVSVLQRERGGGAEASAAAEQYRYFASRRLDDMQRVTALEQNIDAAVWDRAPELRATRSRGRRRQRCEEAGDAGGEGDADA